LFLFLVCMQGNEKGRSNKSKLCIGVVEKSPGRGELWLSFLTGV
jgi:hypothetical protein